MRLNVYGDFHLHIHPNLAGGDLDFLNKKLALILLNQGNLMTKVSEFAAAQSAHNDRMGVALDGISTDIAALNAKIAELQNSAGQITPEDQTLLDALQAQGEALAGRIEAADAMTPPAVPVA